MASWALSIENSMHDFSQLEHRLGLAFQDKELLTQAFVHRSYLNENPSFSLFHNERLEFLGDAVLELVVTEHLYRQYPHTPEGELTSWRAALVNARMLSEMSHELNFNDFLLLSRGEQKETGKARDYILANTFEAFIGALYLDQGLQHAEKFVAAHLFPHLGVILEQKLYRDAKSRFQEIAQEKMSITPSYQVLQEWGPDHAKHFVMGVFLGEECVAQGQGSSKQEAEEKAAQNAIAAKGWE